MDAALTRKGGFTLAEILLSLSLITIVVLALLGLSIRSLKGTQKSEDLTVGQLVAEQHIERLIYEAETNATSPFWAHNNPSAPYSTQTVDSNGSKFQLSIYISDVSASVDGGFSVGRRLKLVQGDVTWHDAPQGKRDLGILNIRVSRMVHEP